MQQHQSWGATDYLSRMVAARAAAGEQVRVEEFFFSIDFGSLAASTRSAIPQFVKVQPESDYLWMGTSARLQVGGLSSTDVFALYSVRVRVTSSGALISDHRALTDPNAVGFAPLRSFAGCGDTGFLALVPFGVSILSRPFLWPRPFYLQGGETLEFEGFNEDATGARRVRMVLHGVKLYRGARGQAA